MKKLYFILALCVTGVSVIAQQNQQAKLVVQKPIYFDVSPPLRDIAKGLKTKADVSWKDGIVMNHFNFRPNRNPVSPFFKDNCLQDHNGLLPSDTTIQNFEGLGGSSYIPPDTYGDVGPEHYFQVVNCSYAIYNKTGTKLLGPLSSSSVWNGMPNNVNSGDAVVVYDENANRWMFSQFSLPYYPNGPFFMMIAISQTPDPTGSWYRYQYSFADMPDYPKFGIWPDGYYMSVNRFGPAGYEGTGAAAFDRTGMLNGDPDAQMIWFMLSGSNEAFSLLPADCDGTFPPGGTPEYFTYISGGSGSHLGILEFHADWNTPSNSTIGNLNSIPVNNFNSDLGNGIPQLGTSVALEALSDRLMYRQQFRKFSDHWSMVCNHTVNAGNYVAGVRWYEIRKTSGSWALYQQSTYSPDTKSRWMGSMAIDTAGNIALGYSVSSPSMYPGIRYTGRLRSDPLNQMTIAEKGIMNGGGCQLSPVSRWGDYSSMTVDPGSPTTFWYTTEYYSYTTSVGWQTRIASFTFGNIFSSYATASPANICQGSSSQLEAVAYGGSENYTYLWSSVPPGFTSTLKSPIVTPSDTTKYLVAVSDGITVHHDTINVTVAPYPYLYAGNDTTICKYVPSLQLQGAAQNYTSVTWGTSGNGAFSNRNSLNPVYTFGSHDYQADSVDLYMVIFDNDPCPRILTSTRHVVLDPCTGIYDKPSDAVSLLLQPNPAGSFVNMVINGLHNNSVTITMTSLDGRTLLKEEFLVTSDVFTKKINLERFPKGVFIMKMITGSVTSAKELVIQ